MYFDRQIIGVCCGVDGRSKLLVRRRWLLLLRALVGLGKLPRTDWPSSSSGGGVSVGGGEDGGAGLGVGEPLVGVGRDGVG